MLTKLKKRNEGFTIIEVLIVLAIAGLIMLIVFLAVPALQRNSRNTAIKQDVANVLGGISEFQGANSGSMPTSVAGTGTVNYTSASGNATTARIQGSTEVATVTTVPTAVNPGRIEVFLQRKCNDATTNTRAAAAYFSIETSSGRVLQCQDS